MNELITLVTNSLLVSSQLTSHHGAGASGFRHILLGVHMCDLCMTYSLKTQSNHGVRCSPRASDPKMAESPVSMMHESSSYACSQDGYFKCLLTMSIDGGNRPNSGWILVGFGICRRLTCD